MSVNDILESLQRKLQAAKSPIVARHTVAGIFATLRKPGIGVETRANVITLCLSRPYKVIVQEAADQLLALTRAGGLPAAEAAEFLLSAITTAGSATAAALADALCQLVVSPAAHIGVTGAAAGASDSAANAQPLLRPTRWTSHPLVAALLSNPAAATQLLSSAIAALGGEVAAAAAATAEAAAGGAVSGTAGSAASGVAAITAAPSASLERTWSSLEPFFSFVLLQRHPLATERAGAGASASASAASASSGAASALAAVALAAWLHSQLVRLAVGEPYGAPPWLRRQLLAFLVAHLVLGPRGLEADRMQAVQATTDLLDVLEAVLYDREGEVAVTITATTGGLRRLDDCCYPETSVAMPVAAALMQLAFEIIVGPGGGGGGGGGGGAQEVVAALLRLQRVAPSALQNHLAESSLLTLHAYGKELQGLHRLLHKALRHSHQHHHSPQQPPPPPPQQQWQQWQYGPKQTSVGPSAADAALSLQPLLAEVAFGTSAAPSGAVPASTWPAHLAAALQQIMDTGTGNSSGSGCSSRKAHGDLCLIRQCRWLLLSLWAEATATASDCRGGLPSPSPSPLPCDLLRWLRSLEMALRQRRRMAAAAKAVSEQLPFVTKISDVVSDASLGAMDSHPALTCLLAALLAHPNPRVRAAAAAAARQLVQLLPAAALPLLPVVMYQLRRGGVAGADEYSGGSIGSSNAAQLALLQLLPVMAADPAVAPYALRVLQPMLQPESPEMLRCLALKLLCDTWLISGRGWPQVESALNGLVAPGSRNPPPSLRITRAALLRAVCDRDPGRGVELVSALQQAIRDPDCPAAAALALEALAVLAEEDVLDFYKAYRVVHRWHPSLPVDPPVASCWVALLAHGSLDAEVYPNKAAAILDILWAASRHPDAEVRAAAYSAISRYPLDLMEKLQILRPLNQYTAPLLRETDPRVSEAARDLAAVALRFEHANRRRLLMTQPASEATQDQNAADSTNQTGGGDGGDGAASRSKGMAFAAAATAREARALRGRLLGRIPKMLLAGANPAGGAAAGRPPGGGGGGVGVAAGGGFHPGTALFCYSQPRPPPLPPGSSAAAIAAAARRATAEAREAYGTRLRDGLRRLAWRGHWHARLAVQAWATFIGHWMYDTGLTAADVAAVLVSEWNGTAAGAGGAASGGAGSTAAASSNAATTGVGGATAAPAAVLEGVGLAAGALCLTAEGLPEADVSFLTAKLLQQAQSGRSSGISRTSLLGAALSASKLHPTDWAARQQVLGELRVQLLAGPSAVVRSAAATALAVLVGSLAADPAIYIRTGGGGGGGGSDDGGGGGGGAHQSRELFAVAEALSCLIAALGGLCPALAAPLAELAARGMPPDWPALEGAAYVKAPRPLKDEVDEQEVLPGTAVSLASLLCDVNRAHGLPTETLPHFLSALMLVAAAAAAGDGTGGSGHGIGTASSASAAVTVAALEAAAVLAPETIRYQQMPASELKGVIRTMRELMGIHSEVVGGESCSSGGSSVAVSGNGGDGRVRGAAAYCLACVAVAALRQGLLAQELVSELGLMPVASPSPLRRTGSEDSGLTILLALVSELEEQACAVSSGGAAAASKGQYTVAARMGAVAGLAAVLVPPPSSLVDALAPIPAGALGTGLLAQPEHLTPAKAAVRALERLAMSDADPWVSATAAFHLAAIAAAVEAAEDGGGDDGIGPSGVGG
ncbi:hypothetical protein VaNZ11_003262, partial [Volvox africanus]